MSNALVSCASCHRHVRVADARCPFCGATVVGIEPLHRPLRRGRGLTRSAILLGTVLGAAACGGGSSAEPSAEDTSGGEESNENADDAADTTGEGTEEATPEAAPDDPGGPVAMYGAPAPN